MGVTSELPVVHRTRRERTADGKAARSQAPLKAHRRFHPEPSRDPIALLLEQERNRVADLVPIRHGRMLVSPFSYFRGAALPMAADLAAHPSSGLIVQLCGDAHLSNFGAFASPERRLVFDINDFDETLPGPFEWDVKRLVASVSVAGRDNGFDEKQRRRTLIAASSGYRQAMADFAGRSIMDVWYAHLDIAAVVDEFKAEISKKRAKAVEGLLAKARTRDSMQALRKLTTVENGKRVFVNDPPLIVPIENVFADEDVDALYERLHGALRSYRKTLQPDRRHLLEQFELVKVAHKVVGVGSVGTRAWVLLLEAGDGIEPLFLQGKEAQPSVLADYVGRSRFTNDGQRVVTGQHLMQAASDIFLGWTRVVGQDAVERDFYVRQLRDWKLSLPVEQMTPRGMERYAGVCGWTLARAHARSGDRVAIAAYLGASDTFDRALVEFAETYADQNEQDHAALAKAVESGRVKAISGL